MCDQLSNTILQKEGGLKHARIKQHLSQTSLEKIIPLCIKGGAVPEIERKDHEKWGVQVTERRDTRLNAWATYKSSILDPSGIPIYLHARGGESPGDFHSTVCKAISLFICCFSHVTARVFLSYTDTFSLSLHLDWGVLKLLPFLPTRLFQTYPITKESSQDVKCSVCSVLPKGSGAMMLGCFLMTG